ncbi:hypothetical protein QP337_29285, partial [Escherichia coli]|nr:hypothetical protein [Escherichia coli]
RVFLVILFTSFSGSLVSRIPGAVQNIIRLQPLHFSYEKGRRVLSLRPDPGANCHYGSLTPV